MRHLSLYREPVRRRVATGILLVLQMVAWLAMPLADARAEARSAGATAHVESDTSGRCTPVHQHAACVVCRTLRTLGVTAGGASMAPLQRRNEDADVTRYVSPPAGNRGRAGHPRAPPIH